jgi:hypothetical protein
LLQRKNLWVIQRLLTELSARKQKSCRILGSILKVFLLATVFGNSMSIP